MVPGCWYDLSCRISAALSVVNAIDCYMPVGDRAIPVMNELSSIGDMVAAASDILKLCQNDCSELEKALLEIQGKGS